MARSSSGKSMQGRPMKTHNRNRQNSQSQSSGGRELGHITEPMQAEMASGNEGLAESPGSQEQNRNRSMRRMKRAA